MTSPHTWDDITVDQLVARGSRKWTQYPGSLGAFVAEEDFGVAPEIQAAVQNAVARSAYGYIAPTAVGTLKRATADEYRTRYGWAVKADSIKLTSDVLAGLEATVRVFLRRSDSPIIVPTPAYMPFLTLPKLFGHDVITVPMLRDIEGWHLDLLGIGAAFEAGAELLVLTNPHNPTGKVFRRAELEELAGIVTRHGGRVFSDEIHAPLVLEGEHVPYATVSSSAAAHTVTATSASKAWNVPGLKCAQLILSNPADNDLWQQHETWRESAVTPLGVLAATIAYRDGDAWLGELKSYLRRNLDALDELIPRLLPRAVYSRPAGTYIIWIDVSAYDLPADLGAWLRDTAHVAVTDGSACGVAEGTAIRLVVATPLPILVQMIEQIGSALAGRER